MPTTLHVAALTWRSPTTTACTAITALPPPKQLSTVSTLLSLAGKPPPLLTKALQSAGMVATLVLLSYMESAGVDRKLLYVAAIGADFCSRTAIGWFVDKVWEIGRAFLHRRLVPA